MPEEIVPDIELTNKITLALEEVIAIVCRESKLDNNVKNVRTLALILADIGLRLVYYKTNSTDDLEDISQLINGRVEELIEFYKEEKKKA